MNQPLYGNTQMRNPSMDINTRSPYYDPNNYYEKNPIMQPPVYDYINPSSTLMPMN
jgi:hypothetical protein